MKWQRTLLVLKLTLTLLNVGLHEGRCTQVFRPSISMMDCLTPVVALKNPSECDWFPVIVECENITKIIPCTCPRFSVSRKEQDEFQFLPIFVQSTRLIRDFKVWKFPTDHRLYRTFPIDPELKNYVRQVRRAVFSVVQPVAFNTGSRLAAISTRVLTDILDLSQGVAFSSDFLNFVSGNLETDSSRTTTFVPINRNIAVLDTPLPSDGLKDKLLCTQSGSLSRVIPLSHRYGGHQFGQWAGQLGDGRAVMLGEYVNSQGVRWELQLKGSGLTPYSRQGDGRAVVRSSVREFLCSEAMHHLGIPTSRAATLVISNDTVIRDQFYNGHPQMEMTAVVLRVARSWFRIGSLEILTHSGEYDLLKQLMDFVIAEYFPEIDDTGSGKYLAFFQEVVRNTAFLMAQWQSVGFTHGVCNTDNFSLLSMTIDYGPFGFLDEYNPAFIPNTSDNEGRYSYEKQPTVGAYNLEKLRIALEPLLLEADKSVSHTILMSYSEHYKSKYMEIFRKKLGLATDQGEEDENIVAVLLRIMSDTKADFTSTFRDLSEASLSELIEGKIKKKRWALSTAAEHEWFKEWVRLYVERLESEEQTDRRQHIMLSTNPRYVLRNWIAQLAVQRTEQNDYSFVKKIHRILQKPYTYQEEAEELDLADRPPVWSKQLKVSCSS